MMNYSNLDIDGPVATPGPDASPLRKAYATVSQYGFVNRNYEALRRTVQFTQQRRFYNLRSFFLNWMNVLGLLVFLFCVFVAIIGPFYTQDPTYRDPAIKHLQAFSYDPSGTMHWLGTDLNGSDNLARLVHGLAFSLGLAAMATIIDIVLGLFLGMLQGYFSIVDKYVRWLTQIVQNVPSTLWIILMALILTPSFWSIVLGISITGWLGMSYLARGTVIGLKNKDYVTASRIMATNPFKIMTFMLPQLFPVIIAQLLWTISGAILGDTVVALLGLGIPNTASLGNIINNANTTVLIYPIEAVWPVLVIVVFSLSVQLVGNGIAENVNRSNK